ncbi:uncharacterized protein KY384_005575 [Bacidia gigantensis]|uniref:uncharacterized protein n=1 Tax=Bacidia gigantensis TaxID=2732470 RepID=UPI001D03E459|nr:uncharacterized protein KY384_005575 [Bacidia gigantensis]KAG8530093.1 hypothetical protein KY384_005575 [Bacidia gigantensis]
MPASHRSRSSNRRPKHVPLAEDLVSTAPIRTKTKKRKTQPDVEDGTSKSYVDSRSSRKILKIGHDLQDEENEEAKSSLPNLAFAFESRFGATSEGDSDDGNAGGLHDDDEAWGSAEEAASEAEIDPSDLDLFNKFNPTVQSDSTAQQIASPAPADSGGGTNLADLILEKIALHEAQNPTIITDAPHATTPLNHYADPEPLPPKSSKSTPRSATSSPATNPAHSPNRSKSYPPYPSGQTSFPSQPRTPGPPTPATKPRVSSSPPPHPVREDIHERKKLNVHLYKALKKGLYKPAPWFKGFLFPLVGSTTCTLREAHVVSSVLARVSVPVLHSAAALLRLTEIAAEQASGRLGMEAAGATNVFIRVLLEKKYALPYKVVDGLVFHFLRYRVTVRQNEGDERGGKRVGEGSGEQKLPVLWHQCLLAFAQRYRNDITEDQRESLLDLLVSVGHPAIGPEVRRELLAGRGRGVPLEDERMDGGDDTMVVDGAGLS